MVFGVLVVTALSVWGQKKKVATKPVSGALAAQIASGKQVYIKYCLSCHQADGGGVQNMNPPLTGTTYVLGDKGAIIKVVLNGFKEPVDINGQSYGNTMASFSNLSDKEVADVITYVRNSFGNKAGAVSQGDVAGVRRILKTK